MNGHTTDRAALRGGLWVLAAVLAGLVVLRAGHVGPAAGPGIAVAEMTAESGAYSAMTTASGTEELLYLIDQRSETLMVFGVRNGRAVELRNRQSLPQMFTAARAAWLGTVPNRTRP